jgi:hypothetical protein
VTGPAARFGPAQQDAAADALLAEARVLPDAGSPRADAAG